MRSNGSGRRCFEMPLRQHASTHLQYQVSKLAKVVTRATLGKKAGSRVFAGVQCVLPPLPRKGKSMNALSLLTRSALAAALIGFGGAAIAQTKAPAAPSAKDKAAIEAAFAKADANGDGKLSKDEVAPMPQIVARFDQLDKNKDGGLSLEEFAAAMMA
jgi:hypothetical protein